MLKRLVAQLWQDEKEIGDVIVRCEATDEDEVALHAMYDDDVRSSIYVGREEACLLAVLLIAAAHSTPA